jgi:hypothetical protein
LKKPNQKSIEFKGLSNEMTAKPLETIQIKSKNFWKSLVKAKRIKRDKS